MNRVSHTGVQGLGVAVVVYAALVAWLVLAPPIRRPSERREPTRVRIVETPRPEPVPAPPPPRPEPARRMEAERPRKTPAPPAPAPLLPVQQTPSSSPPPAAAPRRFAVSLEATVPGGGIAVPTAPPGAAPSVRATPGGTGTGPEAPAYVVEPDTGPQLVAQPDLAEMRALYPEGARRAGLEADVRLELEISATGEVVGSRVVRASGNGFDEVAQRLVRRFRFRPAIRGGRPAPATIPWTYKFRLEG